MIEATLLIEAGWKNLVNKTWLVVAPESVVIRRLTRDKGMTEPQILARLRSQTPAEEKIKYADEVIYNDGSFARLESKVTRLWRKYSGN